MSDSPKTEAFPNGPPTARLPAGEGRFAISVRNYRLRQLIGSGGMGEVYEADQERPVRRRVALKVVKLGMDTREVVTRFESERQALALMNHPSIARVFDGGATDQGRPFFAMELVSGEPITDYCDRHRLSIRRRLELFLQVCDGVQHAHQKGIIHRDLKPSNVLVTVQDDRPVPKIIDFGVAKAVIQPLTDKTMVTRLGTVIGTPEYMSPEQAELTGLDVDTRTDVYSLGVLLYELLVGARPFEADEPGSAGFVALQSRIREVDPPRPSTRLSTLGGSAEGVAAARRVELKGLTRSLRGDLDWIILKALEKDRTRRYETVNALALDIRRHLRDEPVRASPPSTLYRVRKFVRRHRSGVAAVLLVSLALVAGVVGTTIGLVRAISAERRAVQEAETARQVSDFLVGLFRVADPAAAQGETITAREILDAGAERVTRELADRPVTQARLMHTIGTVYRQLGLYGQALPLLEQTVAIREQHLGDASHETASSRLDLSILMRRKGDYEHAEALARQALGAREAILGPTHPDVAEAQAALGWALLRMEKIDEAEALLERALEIREATLGSDHPDTAMSRTDLGGLLWRQGKYGPAEELLRQALATFEKALEPDDYRVRATLNDLAVLAWTQAKYDDALPLFKRSLEIKERVLGDEHPEVAATLNNLALLHDAENRPAAALPLLERARVIYEKSLGRNHDKTALTLGNLAWINYRLGQYEAAIPLYDLSLAAFENSVGRQHTSVAILLRDEARLYADLERWPRAEELLEESRAIWEATLGDDHPEVAECLHLLGDLYARQDRLADAEPLLRRALAIRQEKLGREHPSVAETTAALADLLRRDGRVAEAEVLEGTGT